MGGKGGGDTPTVTQPTVTPSPYETQLASIASGIYGSTDPLRSTMIKSWMDFLNPTPTLRAGAQPTMIPQYSSTPGTAATPQMYQDASGILYGANNVTKDDNGLYFTNPIGYDPYDSMAGSIRVNPYEMPSDGTTGSQQITGYTAQYAPSDYVTQQFNPANLPGYNPTYDISRRGVEAQYNTAVQQAIGGTPRGGAMSDALNKLNLARAESVGQLPGQISSSLIQDQLNKAYGAAFNAPSQAISGLSAANQGYVSTQNSMINAQMQANALAQQQQNSKGSGLGVLGSGLGTVVGSVFGGPVGGAAGSTLGGRIGSKIG